MFRTADPTRKVPVWLQSHTKENIIWQLKMLGLFYVGYFAWNKYVDWKYERSVKNLP